MDYIMETVTLGLDLVILVVCANQYYKTKYAAALIQQAPHLSSTKEIKELMEFLPEKKLPYVSVRGTVKALGSPIVSIDNKDVTGVLQLSQLKEHFHVKSSSGFWTQSQNVIQEIYNVIPFAITGRGMQVEVTDPVAADILDMDVISDVFTPSKNTVIDHIWGFLSGIRGMGTQSTESMLREGTMITGIGELIYCSDSNSYCLQPPKNGAPFYLTKMPVTWLIKKLDESKRNYGLACVSLGILGTVVSGLIVRKYFRQRKSIQKERKKKQQLEEMRRLRRREVRDGNLTDTQICVICKCNPIEIILLPCGHVCLCEDCSVKIADNCPICRTVIENKSIAFFM